MCILFLNLLLLSAPVFAGWFSELPECSIHLAKGQECRTTIKSLRPSQGSLGGGAEKIRATAIAQMNEEEFKTFRKEKKPKIIIGPPMEIDGMPTYWLVDGHHKAAAMLDVKGEKEELAVDVEENWSGETREDFKKLMLGESLNGENPDKRVYARLVDEFGMPIEWKDLPKSVSEFSKHDDPFRTMAWLLRRSKGFEKIIDESERAFPEFGEFSWADALREELYGELRVLKGAKKIEALIRIYESLKNPKEFEYSMQRALLFASSGKSDSLPGAKIFQKTDSLSGAIDCLGFYKNLSERMDILRGLPK